MARCWKLTGGDNFQRLLPRHQCCPHQIHCPAPSDRSCGSVCKCNGLSWTYNRGCYQNYRHCVSTDSFSQHDYTSEDILQWLTDSQLYPTWCCKHDVPNQHQLLQRRSSTCCLRCFQFVHCWWRVLKLGWYVAGLFLELRYWPKTPPVLFEGYSTQAVKAVPAADTAFPHREDNFLMYVDPPHPLSLFSP